MVMVVDLKPLPRIIQPRSLRSLRRAWELEDELLMCFDVRTEVVMEMEERTRENLSVAVGVAGAAWECECNSPLPSS